MIGLSRTNNFTKARTGFGGNYPNIPDNSTIDYGNSYAKNLVESGISYYAMDKMYSHNVWIRAVIDKIVERASNVPVLIKPIRTSDSAIPDATKRNMERVQQLLIRPNDQFETFNTILKKYLRDILKFDAHGIEIAIQSIGGKVTPDIYSVAGNTIRLNLDNKSNLIQDSAYQQIDNAQKIIATWPANRLMYFMNNPQSNRNYGFSPLETLVQTVTAELYSSQYNLDFFYNNATPRIAIMMEGLGTGQGSSALKRIREWWDKELKGKPHSPIILGTEHGSVKIEKVAMSNKDMEFMEYSKWLLQKIMAIYKMPATILGISNGEQSNKGDLAEQVSQFKIEAINPLLSNIYQRLNLQLIFNPNIYAINDVYIDYDLDIADKTKQAEYHERYMRSGVLTINEIRSSGLGLPPVPWGNVPYMQNNVAPFGIGPNGAAVPITDLAGMVPNDPNNSAQVMDVGIVARSLPVGWEHMESSGQKEIISKLLKDRNSILSKAFSFKS